MFRPHTEETKTKMSIIKLKNPVKYWLGKHVPAEIVAKRKKTRAQKPSPKGWKLSPETRARMSLAKTGDKNSLWKGGRRSLQLIIRQNNKYKAWRNDVFARDNFVCTECGASKCYIEADHYPMKFSEILDTNTIKSLKAALLCEELWDINNGRTLCRPCHDKTKRRN